LATAFLASAAGSERAAPKLTPAAQKLLEAYPWPGNIRELRNVMERALLLATSDVITPEELPLDKMRGTPVATMAASIGTTVRAPTTRAAVPDDDRSEYDQIVDCLARCNCNQTRAAKMMGMPRRTFCARLKAYNIPRPRA